MKYNFKMTLIFLLFFEVDENALIKKKCKSQHSKSKSNENKIKK
jgi:hypothetical protein